VPVGEAIINGILYVSMLVYLTAILTVCIHGEPYKCRDILADKSKVTASHLNIPKVTASHLNIPKVTAIHQNIPKVTASHQNIPKLRFAQTITLSMYLKT
jgi:hypothetical protein